MKDEQLMEKEGRERDRDEEEKGVERKERKAPLGGE